MQVIVKKADTALVMMDNGLFVVACGYDVSRPDGEKWNAGHYFGDVYHPYDPVALSKAIEYFRLRTEQEYISRDRFSELATRFLDCINEDEDFDCTVQDMEAYEREYFCIVEE